MCQYILEYSSEMHYTQAVGIILGTLDAFRFMFKLHLIVSIRKCVVVDRPVASTEDPLQIMSLCHGQSD